MNRVRKLFLEVLFILTVICTCSTILEVGLAKTNLQTYDYTVKGNDTLWTIAGKICDDYKDINIRKVISDIKEINELNDSVIYKNQILKLPIYD